MRRLIVFVLLFNLATTVAEASTLHLIVATDDLARSDNPADSIGSGCAVDKETILSVFREGIGNEHQLKEYIIAPLKMTRDSILRTLSKIQFSDGDSVCFYYAGHGSMSQTATEKRLVLQLTGAETSTIQANELRSALLRSPGVAPKTTLILTDCCFSATNVGGWAAGAKGEKRVLIPHLFFNQSGVFHINSCAPGQRAVQLRGGFGNSYEDKGGIFTVSFSQLCWARREDSLSWGEFFCALRSGTADAYERTWELNENAQREPLSFETCQDTQTPFLVTPDETAIVLDEAKRLRLGVYFDNGLVVQKVLDSSPAKGILQPSDRIVRVMDGCGRMVEPKSHDHFVSILSMSGQLLRYEVARPTKAGSFENFGQSINLSY